MLRTPLLRADEDIGPYDRHCERSEAIQTLVFVKKSHTGCGGKTSALRHCGHRAAISKPHERTGIADQARNDKEGVAVPYLYTVLCTLNNRA